MNGRQPLNKVLWPHCRGGHTLSYLLDKQLCHAFELQRAPLWYAGRGAWQGAVGKLLAAAGAFCGTKWHSGRSKGGGHAPQFSKENNTTACKAHHCLQQHESMGVTLQQQIASQHLFNVADPV
jgi:hypothetical protein